MYASVDVKNSAPTICLELARKDGIAHKFPHLSRYVNERTDVLNEFCDYYGISPKAGKFVALGVFDGVTPEHLHNWLNKRLKKQGQTRFVFGKEPHHIYKSLWEEFEVLQDYAFERQTPDTLAVVDAHLENILCQKLKTMQDIWTCSRIVKAAQMGARVRQMYILNLCWEEVERQALEVMFEHTGRNPCSIPLFDGILVFNTKPQQLNTVKITDAIASELDIVLEVSDKSAQDESEAVDIVVCKRIVVLKQSDTIVEIIPA